MDPDYVPEENISESPLTQNEEVEPPEREMQEETVHQMKNGDHYRWRKREPAVVPSNFLGQDFLDLDAVLTPLQYFKQFFDDDLIKSISEETNRYCIQQKVKNNLKCKLIDTDKDEIEQFIGVLLYMGIYPHPQYRMYWNPKCFLPQITEALKGGVNRFENLKRFLHFNDNTKMPEYNSSSYDKVYKIRPILDSVVKKCQNLKPEEYNSVDEQMIPTKCSSSLKQYMPNKPHKWGFKIFTRCGVSGIIYDFEIYIGKNNNQPSNLGVTGDLVMRLCANLPQDQNFKVYFDNFFTSFSLLKELKSIGILSLGTMRSNRMAGVQKILTSDKKLKLEGRGSYDWRVDASSNIVVLKWQDNNTVLLASTFMRQNLGEKVKRWSAKDKSHVYIDCPEMVHEYNKFMGGVDLNDMLLSLYRIKLRSKKWYMPIFYYLIKVAVTNGWLLYRKHYKHLYPHEKKFMSLLEFQTEIASGLVQSGKLPSIISNKRGRPSSSPVSAKNKPKTSSAILIPSNDIRFDGVGHLPLYHEKQHRCRCCPKGYSHMHCMKCKIFLCFTKDRNCFVDFHMKK